jgi:FAD/FMN-containing dehydrogenase
MSKDAFRARVRGPVFTPGDAGYAPEIAVFNTAVVQTPELVVGAASSDDILESVRVARELGLCVSVQGAGHGGLRPVRSGVLITTRRLDQVSIDPGSRIATIGAGTRWSKVVAAAGEHGLAPICGSSTDVGVVGYLLGGGLGPLARSHGFSSDYLVSLRVVTGTGELVDASATERPDLFWALRGGKGGLGLVTELCLRLVPLRTLYAGSLAFDEPQLEQALRGYVDWTRRADPRVTTSAAIIRYPDLEAVPAIFRGRRLINVRSAFPGANEEGERLARPLRSLAPVYLDGLGELQAVDVAKISNDPRDPMPSSIVALLLGAIDQDFVSRLLGSLGTDSPFVAAELRHLGEATRVDVPEGSAVGGRAAEYSLGLVATNPAYFESVVPAAADRLRQALGSYIAPETNINFLGSPRSQEHFESAWSKATFARLADVRKRYDPDSVFSFGV